MTDQEPPGDDVRKSGMYFPNSDSQRHKDLFQGREASVEEEKEKEKQDWLDSAKQGREIATNAHKKAMENPAYAKKVELQKLSNQNVDAVGTDEEKKALTESRERDADESAIEENRKDFEKHLEKVKDESRKEADARLAAAGETKPPAAGTYVPISAEITDEDKKKFEERQNTDEPPKEEEGGEKPEDLDKDSVIEDRSGQLSGMNNPDLTYRYMEKVGSAIAQAAAEMGGSMVSRGWDLASDIVRMTFTQPHAMSSTSRMIGTAMGSLELAGDFADRAAQKYGVNLQQDPELIKDTIKYKLYQREAKQANGVVGNTFRAISDSLGKMGVQDISQMTPDQLSQHVADMRQEASRLMGIIAKDKENLQLGKRQNRLSSQDRGLVYAQAKHLQSYLDQLSKQGATMAADQRMMARQQRQASRRQRMQAQSTLANGSANPYQQILQWADPNANWEIDGNTGMPTQTGAYNIMLRTLRDRREQERRANNGVLDPTRAQWYDDMDRNLTQRRDDVQRETRQAPIRQYGNVFVGMSDHAPGIGPHINRILRFGIWPSTVPVKSIRDYLANIVQKGATQGASAAEINHARALLLSLDMHTRTRTMMSKIGRIDPRSAANAMRYHIQVGDVWRTTRLDAAEAQKDEAILSKAYMAFNAKLPKDFATAQNFNPNDPAFQQALHNYERELIKYENKWFPLRAGNRQRQPGQAGSGQTPPGPGPQNQNQTPQNQNNGAGAGAPGGGRRAGGGGKGGAVNPAGNPNKGRRARYNKDLINVFTPGNLPDADRNTRLREIIGDNVLKLNKWGRFMNKEDFDAALAALKTYHETYNSDTSLNDKTINAFEKIFGPNPKKDQYDEVHAANEDVLKQLFTDNGIALDANGKLSKEEYKKAMNLLDNLYPEVAQDKKKRLLAGFIAPATPTPKPRTEEIDAADPASDADADDEPEFFDDGSRNWVVMPMVSGDDTKDMESAKKVYDALGDDPKAFLEDVLQKVNTKSDKVKFTDVGQMLDAFGRLGSMDPDDPLADIDVYMETKNRPRDDPVYQATIAASRVADMRPQLEKMGVWDNIVGTPAQPQASDTHQTEAEVPQTPVTEESDVDPWKKDDDTDDKDGGEGETSDPGKFEIKDPDDVEYGHGLRLSMFQPLTSSMDDRRRRAIQTDIGLLDHSDPKVRNDAYERVVASSNGMSPEAYSDFVKEMAENDIPSAWADVANGIALQDPESSFKADLAGIFAEKLFLSSFNETDLDDAVTNAKRIGLSEEQVENISKEAVTTLNSGNENIIRSLYDVYKKTVMDVLKDDSSEQPRATETEAPQTPASDADTSLEQDQKEGTDEFVEDEDVEEPVKKPKELDPADREKADSIRRHMGFGDDEDSFRKYIDETIKKVNNSYTSLSGISNNRLTGYGKGSNGFWDKFIAQVQKDGKEIPPDMSRDLFREAMAPWIGLEFQRGTLESLKNKSKAEWIERKEKRKTQLEEQQAELHRATDEIRKKRDEDETFERTTIEGDEESGINETKTGVKKERPPVPPLFNEKGKKLEYRGTGLFENIINFTKGMSKMGPEERRASIGDVESYNKELQKRFDEAARLFGNPRIIERVYNDKIKAEKSRVEEALKTSLDRSIRNARMEAEKDKEKVLAEAKRIESFNRIAKDEDKQKLIDVNSEIQKIDSKLNTTIATLRANYPANLETRLKAIDANAEKYLPEIQKNFNDQVEILNIASGKWSEYVKDLVDKPAGLRKQLQKVAVNESSEEGLQTTGSIQLETPDPDSILEEFKHTGNMESYAETVQKLKDSIRERYPGVDPTKKNQVITKYTLELNKIRESLSGDSKNRKIMDVTDRQNRAKYIRDSVDALENAKKIGINEDVLKNIAKKIIETVSEEYEPSQVLYKDVNNKLNKLFPAPEGQRTVIQPVEKESYGDPQLDMAVESIRKKYGDPERAEAEIQELLKQYNDKKKQIADSIVPMLTDLEQAVSNKEIFEPRQFIQFRRLIDESILSPDEKKAANSRLDKIIETYREYNPVEEWQKPQYAKKKSLEEISTESRARYEQLINSGTADLRKLAMDLEYDNTLLPEDRQVIKNLLNPKQSGSEAIDEVEIDGEAKHEPPIKYKTNVLPDQSRTVLEDYFYDIDLGYDDDVINAAVDKAINGDWTAYVDLIKKTNDKDDLVNRLNSLSKVFKDNGIKEGEQIIQDIRSEPRVIQLLSKSFREIMRERNPDWE